MKPELNTTRTLQKGKKSNSYYVVIPSDILEYNNIEAENYSIVQFSADGEKITISLR